MSAAKTTASYRISVVCFSFMVGFLALSAITEADDNNVPRLAEFTIRSNSSRVEVSLFTGDATSRLGGKLALVLEDPSDPAGAVDPSQDRVRVRVHRADLIAPDFTPDGVIREPLEMQLDPNGDSTGWYSCATGQIEFALYLVGVEASGGQLPVPMPIVLEGRLRGGRLSVAGDNGMPPDAGMAMRIRAFETPHRPRMLFSTEIGFGSASPSGVVIPMSDGDLLHNRGFRLLTNQELTANLGIMPVAPDVGLDAVYRTLHDDFWFSIEQDVWSETLGRLGHGDLLSTAGYIVRTNAELIDAFDPVVSSADGVGLDAIYVRGLNNTADVVHNRGHFLFSTEVDFRSANNNRLLRHGDLLSDAGRVVLTNAQLLSRFHPIGSSTDPHDYGLDAVHLLRRHDVWFSVEEGFEDARLGWIGEGDVLSIRGYVVRRNRQLMRRFHPVEDVADFGLDSLHVLGPVLDGDADQDGDVDLTDFLRFQECFSGPAGDSNSDCGAFDFDGDGNVDLADFLAFQAAFTGRSGSADAD